MIAFDRATVLTIAAAVLAGLATLSLFVAILRIFQRNRTSDRLSAYLTSRDAEREAQESGDPALVNKLNQAISNQSFADQILRDLAQANLPLTVPEYLLLRAAVPLLLTLAALLIWRTVLAIPPALLLGFILPIFWMGARRRRRNRDFDEQLAETLSIMSSSMRAGFSLVQSIANTARESQEPTRTELMRVNQEIQFGMSLSQALDNLVRRLESEDLDLVVSAIKIHARVGGNLAQIFETISTTIRERGRLRREIHVITSMQRASSYVIGLLPVGLGLAIFAINPGYISRLFLPGWTLCIPIGAVVSSVIGFLIIRRIVDIKV